MTPVDNSRQWAPKTAAVAWVAVGGLALAATAASVATDAPGRLLTAVAALGLLVFAAGSWRARPRLALEGGELVYRGWVSNRRLRPADVESVRVTEFRRLGRKVRLLEIDLLDDSLLVLSRWDLGGDPAGVLPALGGEGFPVR
jgi:hypothetical protein